MSVISFELSGRFGQGKSIQIDAETYERIKHKKISCLESGYAIIWNKETEKAEYFHRWLMGLKSGDKQVVDHIDHNVFNCCLSNLRVVSYSENMCNRKKTSSKTSSIYKGVYFEKKHNRWIAQMKKGGKQIHIGSYDTEK